MRGASIAPVSSRMKWTVRQSTEATFVNEGTLSLMRHVLRGPGRRVLETLGYTKGTAWP
jgi:hypothetical protein